MGREEGEGFRMEGHMYTHDGFMSVYGKNQYSIVISLQLKYIFFKKDSARNTSLMFFKFEFQESKW